ncbi:hypothetical protein Tco_0070580, partial [Tanacetum coccineum]
IMPPKAMSQAAIERLITQRVNAVVEAERARQVNSGRQGSNADRAWGQGGAPAVQECTFSGFMKCNPTVPNSETYLNDMDNQSVHAL